MPLKGLFQSSNLITPHKKTSQIWEVFMFYKSFVKLSNFEKDHNYYFKDSTLALTSSNEPSKT